MRVLITGGTGYFGQAMAEYQRNNICWDLCVLSRSESKQAEMASAFPSAKMMLGDVRDRDRVRRAVRGCDLVVHAAALKRIEVGVSNPSEMVATNVNGTRHVVEACEDYGIDCTVLSTDKAWRPISPYGYTKALAEAIALASGAAVVRYGNVCGSTGSVIPTWRRQLASGKPVRVTDPRCTRFWMTADEAIQMVLSCTGKNDIHTADDLPAYELGDLMLAMGVNYYDTVGLPDHEKLHEGMRDGVTSDVARRMTVEELQEGLKHV